ncbi:MAG: DUF4424 family protein, partial [Sphingomonadaceae bacterium]|nr:DUF4424 family protein [Sphingomonadaceae bacterium]
MRRAAFTAAFLLGAAAVQAAFANDSSAEKAAGGLVLRRSAEIDMVSEDLFVSAAQIRVRYVFRNRSARPATTIVAFPMPDRDLAYEMESEVAYPSDFHTLVEGRPVRMQVERKAMARGVDRSALLARLHIPIGPDARRNVRGIAELIAHLPRPEQQRLARLGLIDAQSFSAPAGEIVPSWTVRETWYWRQTFPAGRNLHVEHRYAPGVGGTAGVPLASHEYRDGQNGRAEQAEYCTDAEFLAAIDRMSARAARDRGNYPME